MTTTCKKGKIGFRINAERRLPRAEDVEAVGRFSTCNLADGLNNFYTVDSAVRAMLPGRMAGPALTVKLSPADNLMLHKAIDMIRPGDVIVVDTHGCRNYCVCGELMVRSMQAKGASGIVVDGTVRDIAELRELGFPVFARGTEPCVGGKSGEGEINYPVVCGGIVVNPGDVIAADENGVVVIPLDDIDEVIDGARKKFESEALRREEIEKGVLVRKSVDDTLRGKGVI